jgi:hypothetical protein
MYDDFSFEFEAQFGDTAPRPKASATDPAHATFSDLDLAPARAQFDLTELAVFDDYWVG